MERKGTEDVEAHTSHHAREGADDLALEEGLNVVREGRVHAHGGAQLVGEGQLKEEDVLVQEGKHGLVLDKILLAHGEVVVADCAGQEHGVQDSLVDGWGADCWLHRI